MLWKVAVTALTFLKPCGFDLNAFLDKGTNCYGKVSKQPLNTPNTI